MDCICHTSLFSFSFFSFCFAVSLTRLRKCSSGIMIGSCLSHTLLFPSRHAFFFRLHFLNHVDGGVGGSQTGHGIHEIRRQEAKRKTADRIDTYRCISGGRGAPPCASRIEIIPINHDYCVLFSASPNLKGVSGPLGNVAWTGADGWFGAANL
jgi:hypothetical protein